MKMKSVTLTKEYKKGLPNYSNITVACSITWELGEGEKMDFKAGWDRINQQIELQDTTEQSWLMTQELKDEYKTVIKTPKKNNQEPLLKGGEQ